MVHSQHTDSIVANNLINNAVLLVDEFTDFRTFNLRHHTPHFREVAKEISFLEYFFDKSFS